MSGDDLPAVVPTAQFFQALAAQLPTQVEVDLFIQAELEAIMTLFARHYDELHVVDGVAELSSTGRLGLRDRVPSRDRLISTRGPYT